MKTNARVVVVGGGMMGASLLYHLALEGCTDTVLAVRVPTIERLGGGSVRCMLTEVPRTT